LQGEKYQLEAQRNSMVAPLQFSKKKLEDNAVKRQQLLEEWKTLKLEIANVSAAEFIEPDEDNFVCPTCGQRLPEDAKENKLEEMRLKFKENLSQSIANVEVAIERNKAAGIALKEDTEAMQASIEKYKDEFDKAGTRLQGIDTRIAEIDAILSQPAATPDYTADPEYTSLQGQIESLQTELDKPVQDTTANLLQNKNEVLNKINACNAILHNKDTAEKNSKRIEELKTEEKRLAGQITEYEGHKYLMEQFVVQKVKLVEGNINSRFKYVTFKMFNQQVKGGIDECCDALVNGVPFSDANHAGKTNGGIDCINALCAYYGVTAPIFIDFRESVTKIIDTDSQIINLIKNEADKALRVEVEE
jgi:exonuclease SbcC